MNPWDSERIRRLLEGIAKAKQPGEADHRVLHPPSFALTPAVIKKLAHLYLSPHPLTVMHYASITLGSFAMLRPGEMLGSPSRPPLLLKNILFYATAGCTAPTVLLPLGVDISIYDVPDRYTITLGITKADRTASNLPSIVCAPLAVSALWKWMHIRRRSATPDDRLFEFAGTPLRTRALCDIIEQSLRRIGYVDPHVTGKTFRRGGASHLVSSGASTASIMALGRWKSHTMHERYADASSKEERRVNASRGMQPL